MDRKSIKYIPFITMLPAIIVGAVAMNLNNIPTSIYLQNILCFVMLGVVFFFIQKSKYKIHKTEPLVFIIISIVVLVFTFISSGIEGVHRWVSVGPIQLYVSVIVVPIIIINLWSLLQEGKIIIAIISIMCVSVILTLQPDVSMMTAFSVSSIILLWNKIKNFSRFLVTVFLSGLTAVTWIFLDGLEPVSYVEGIFKLVIDMGILGLIKDAIEFFSSCVEKKQLPYVLAVELKESGELIGDTGVNEVDGKVDEVEIGYVICKKYSGKGYATELLEAMTEFAESSFVISVLYGRVMRGNDASVKVLEKNRYVFVREEFDAEDDSYGKGMLVYKREL